LVRGIIIGKASLDFSREKCYNYITYKGIVTTFSQLFMRNNVNFNEDNLVLASEYNMVFVGVDYAETVLYFV